MYPTDRSTNSHQHDKKKIAIYGDELKGLAKKIKRGVNGFETIHLTRAGLNAISTADGQLLLLSGSTPLPPESRIAINRYLSAGGNVIVVGDKGSAASDVYKRQKKLWNFLRLRRPCTV